MFNLHWDTLDMPTINGPIPDCEFIIDDVNAILAAAQLNINALIHQQGANVTGAKRNL